jgi:hypothetical protein
MGSSGSKEPLGDVESEKSGKDDIVLRSMDEYVK